jgi:hypothetical protein
MERWPLHGSLSPRASATSPYRQRARTTFQHLPAIEACFRALLWMTRRALICIELDADASGKVAGPLDGRLIWSIAQATRADRNESLTS